MIKLVILLCSWVVLSNSYPHSVRRHEDQYHYNYDPYHVEYDPYSRAHYANYDYHAPIMEERRAYVSPSPVSFEDYPERREWHMNHQHGHQDLAFDNQDYHVRPQDYSAEYSMHADPSNIFVEGHGYKVKKHNAPRDTVYFVHRKDSFGYKPKDNIEQGYGPATESTGKHTEVDKNLYKDTKYRKPLKKKQNVYNEKKHSIETLTAAKHKTSVKTSPKPVTHTKEDDGQVDKVVTEAQKNESSYYVTDGYEMPHKKEAQKQKRHYKDSPKPLEKKEYEFSSNGKHEAPEKHEMDVYDEEYDYEIPVVKTHQKIDIPEKAKPTNKDTKYDEMIEKRTHENQDSDDFATDYYDYDDEAPVVKSTHKHQEVEYENPEIKEALSKKNNIEYETPTVVQAWSVKKNTEKHEEKEYETPTVVKVLTKKEKPLPEDEYETPHVVEVLTKKTKPSKKEQTYAHVNKKTGIAHGVEAKTEDYKSVIRKVNEEEFYLDTNKDKTSTNYKISAKKENDKHEKYPQDTKTKEKLKVKDSLLITQDYDGFNIPIVEAMALEEHEQEHENQERIFPPFVNSNITPDNEIDIKDEEIDNFEGSGTDLNERSSGNTHRSFFPEDSNAWSILTGIQSKERSKFKKCVTPKNETGNCMPIQLCPVTNIASSIDELLKNVCVIDEVFIGACCPEFPVESIPVEWGEFTHENEATSEESDQFPTECGKRTDGAAEKDAWPWMTSLISGSPEKIFCSGVLINEQYVLTAAHCTTRIPRNQIAVRLKHADVIHAKTQDFAVIEIKRHANYNPRTLQNDIAVLKLSKKVKLGKFRQVICLPDEDEDYVELNTILLRWHSKNQKGHSEVLPVIGKKECQRRTGTFISDLVICAEPRTEEESCNADSGAPLVVESGDQFQVIGVLTWNRRDCDERLPTVFTRISSYIGWIKNHAS